MAKKGQALEVVKDDKTQIILRSFNQQLSVWSDKIAKIEADSINLVIASSEQEGAAIDLGKASKQIREEAEELRKSTVQPANEVIKKINATFGFVTDRCDASIKTIKDKILQFRTAEARRMADEQKKKMEQYLKKAEKAKASGKKAPERPTPLQSELNSLIVGKDSAAQLKEVWVFEVVDKTKLPEHYKMADEKALKTAVQSGLRKIEGVKIYQKQSVAIS
jgi:hypothetical protein